MLEHDHVEHGEEIPVKVQKQGNLKPYNEGNVAVRQSLRHHPAVEVLEQMWVSAARHQDTDKGQSLDKEKYRGMHKRMLRACQEKEGMEMTQQEMDDARSRTTERWTRTTVRLRGGGVLDSVFQLADTWCDTVELDEYTGYLKWLQARMFTASDPWFNFKKTVQATCSHHMFALCSVHGIRSQAEVRPRAAEAAGCVRLRRWGHDAQAEQCYKCPEATAVCQSKSECSPRGQVRWRVRVRQCGEGVRSTLPRGRLVLVWRRH